MKRSIAKIANISMIKKIPRSICTTTSYNFPSMSSGFNCFSVELLSNSFVMGENGMKGDHQAIVLGFLEIVVSGQFSSFMLILAHPEPSHVCYDVTTQSVLSKIILRSKTFLFLCIHLKPFCFDLLLLFLTRSIQKYIQNPINIHHIFYIL